MYKLTYSRNFFTYLKKKNDSRKYFYKYKKPQMRSWDLLAQL